MKEIYEVLKECREAKTVTDKLVVLSENDNPTLRQIIQHTYHPQAKWYVNDWPAEYKPIDTLPGMSMTNMYSELRRVYLFQVGHPTADAMTVEKRNELLVNILEGMEPEEAKVFINIFKGDLDIGLELDAIKYLYPGLID
jgi:hypothetical protein